MEDKNVAQSAEFILEEEGKIDSFLEDHFNKKFSFDKHGQNWILPDPSKVWISKKWENGSLLKMKKTLNNTKSKLDDKERTEWHNHTRFCNPAGNIIQELKKKIHPELCTQAWAKFYEIVCSYPDLTSCTKSEHSFNSFHLCEAPGAFITSLNHFLKSSFTFEFEWNWLGVTLNPYYEGNSQSNMISDDRFILNTLDKWCFGKDTTGDIMKICNLDQFKKDAEEIGKINLVTADGSIDCTENPGEQETKVAWLHYCEVIAALMILDEHGNFVIKMFTFYETMSVTILYLLNCVFTKVHVFKPGTSKSGNSEVYVICTDFQKPLIAEYIGVLKNSIETQPEDKSLFSHEHIASEFLDQLEKCCSLFLIAQTKAIERNIYFFKDEVKYEEHINDIKHSCVDYYFDKYEIDRISCRKFVSPPNGRAQARKDLICHFHQGSFNEQIKLSNLPFSKKIKYFENELKSLTSRNQKLAERIQVNVQSGKGWEDRPMFELKSIWGKPFITVLSSRFCYQYLLNLWLKVMLDFKPNNVDEWHISDYDYGYLCDWHTQYKTSCFLELLDPVYSFKGNYNPLEVIKIADDLENSVSKMKLFEDENILETIKNEHKNDYEKLLWIQCILSISEKYNSNKSILISTSDIHTRFIVGCFFILNYMFRKIQLVRPRSAPALNPVTWILCTGSQALPNDYKNELKKIRDEILQRVEFEYEIMEILPINKLTEESFHCWVYSFNEKKMAQRIYTLLEAVKSKGIHT